MKQELVQRSPGIALHQNQPNPFYPATRITFDLPAPEVVTLKILNETGHEIKTLLHEWKDAGRHTIEFNGEGFPAGLYFYRLNAGVFNETKTMLVTR